MREPLVFLVESVQGEQLHPRNRGDITLLAQGSTDDA